MAVKSFQLSVSTKGFCHLENLTERIEGLVGESGLKDGIVCVAVTGSTASISTVEYEPGLLRDIPEFFESIISSKKRYHHDDTWHDGNGFAHLRSFLLKTSHCIPLSGGRLLLGTWQQVVLVDFDNRPRKRSVIVQVIGE